jgi:hypothetical protein
MATQPFFNVGDSLAVQDEFAPLALMRAFSVLVTHMHAEVLTASAPAPVASDANAAVLCCPYSLAAQGELSRLALIYAFSDACILNACDAYARCNAYGASACRQRCRRSRCSTSAYLLATQGELARCLREMP